MYRSRIKDDGGSSTELEAERPEHIAAHQGALEVYLKSGLMERHVPPIRHTYQDRMAAVRQVMAAHCPYPYHVPDAGLFFSLELPAAVCISTLKTELRRKAILIQESSELYLDDFRQRNYLRLAVSNQRPIRCRRCCRSSFRGQPVAGSTIERTVAVESVGKRAEKSGALLSSSLQGIRFCYALPVV